MASIYDEMFEVKEYYGDNSGWYCHFTDDFDKAYKLMDRLLREDGASKVVIKSPHGDMIRTYGKATEVVML